MKKRVRSAIMANANAARVAAKTSADDAVKYAQAVYSLAMAYADLPDESEEASIEEA